MDDFTPDTPNSSTDDFTPDNAGMSGGLPPTNSTSTIDRFRKYISTAGLGPAPNTLDSAVIQQMASVIPAIGLRKLLTTAFPPSTVGSQTPQQSMQADQLGNPDTTVNDFLMVKGIMEAPQALRATGAAIDSLAAAGKNKFQSIMDILKAPGEADKLAPAETELEAGLAAKASKASELQAAKNTKNALYGAFPKDTKAPLPTLNSTAEDILNEIKDLPASIQSKVKSLVSDYQDFGRNGAALGDIGVVRSELGDIATNGDGIEKMYAARLGNALKQDVEAFAHSPTVVPPSQQLEQFAPDLRKAWVNRAVSEAGGDFSAGNAGAQTSDEADKVINYLNKPTPATNTDIGNSIKKANSYYQDFANLQQHPVTQALTKARPEDMAAQIFRRGNVDDVNVAKSVLGDGFKNLQGQFYNQIKDSNNIASFLNKQSPEFLQAAFTPNQLTNLQRLAQFADLVKKAKLAVTALGAGAAITTYEKLH